MAPFALNQNVKSTWVLWWIKA